ncbi:MAG: FAD:protein FMN transferase [Desulfobacterales bacterium]|nr:FAD:protein FMN transferase [Desulfobacterales bacterium]
MKKNCPILAKSILVLMLAAIIWAASISAPVSQTENTDQNVQKGPSHSDTSSFPVENIRPGWWESSGKIYFQIPARILFKLENAPEGAAEKISGQAWMEFERIGRIFNPFDPSSEVSILNSANKSSPLKISNDVYNVLNQSTGIWSASSGHFDPTLMQIKKLWRLAEKNQKIPSEKELFETLKASGFGKVRIIGQPEPSLQADHPNIMFDFGGIVKGYAVDRVREILIAGGAISGLVQLGGEVSTFGDNDGAPWRIGIQHPRQPDTVWGIVSTPGRLNISTSGNYMQPIIIQGHSFYHIFNPKTGKPVSEKILGVTTHSKGGLISNAVLDGSATAITVLGSAAGLEFAKKTGIDVLILFEKKNGEIGEARSSGFIYEKPKGN